MSHVRVVASLEPAQRQLVESLLAAAEAEDGTTLPDHLRLDLLHGPRPGFLAALAEDHQHSDHQHGTRLLGYAQASADLGGYVVDAVLAPWAHPSDRRTLLAFVFDALPPGSSVTWWTRTTDAAEAAELLGMRPQRSLHQMRRRLPVGERSAVVTRDFRVGIDEAQLLEVNNAAFAWHPEQGGWDLDVLAQREREPWFDPAGLRVHERDGRIAAFCWTKLHDSQPPMGEIYVIAVHPDFQGLGLGKALTLAGLDAIADHGVAVGMLHVDGDNVGALQMYERLGFTIHHTERAFVTTTSPRGAVAPRAGA